MYSCREIVGAFFRFDFMSISKSRGTARKCRFYSNYIEMSMGFNIFVEIYWDDSQTLLRNRFPFSPRYSLWIAIVWGIRFVLFLVSSQLAAYSY